MQKTHENSSVLNKQKRTICVFKGWLNCQIGIALKLCCHMKKSSTIQRHRGARSYKNGIRQNFVISYVFSYHIGGTCLVKEIFVVTERCVFFFGVDQKTVRDAHPYLKGARVVTAKVVYEERSSATKKYLQSFIMCPNVPPSRK